MADDSTANVQPPTMDKVEADWQAWHLGVIEQGECRDERIEEILRQTLDEYRAGVAPASRKTAGKNRNGG
jgi:hypothetical protein